MNPTVAVIGGGVSGLAVAEAVERLAQARGLSVRTVVLEADAEPGGKVKSARERGFVADTGPHGFLDKEPAIFELIDRLKLRGELVKANEAAANRFVVRAGKLRKVPSSPPGFVRSDILPFTTKLRVLCEPFARRKPPREESVHEFAARRIGVGAAEMLVDAMVTGIYGGDPKQLSLPSAFPRMAELEERYGGLVKAQLALARERKRLGAGPGAAPAGAPTGTLCSFREGLGTLTRALAAAVQVRTRAPAQRILHLPDAASGAHRFRVEAEGGAVEAHAVVLAPPADEVARLLEEHAPEEAAVMRQIPYAPVSVVIHGFRAQEAGKLDGFGFLAPHREGRKILGAIWASTVFPEHVPEGMIMLRSMVGGARRGELAELSDAEMSSAVRGELASLMGLSEKLEPVYERIIRWPRGIPQYNLGHAARVAAAEAVEARVPGIFLTGNAFRGVAMIACVADAQKVAARVVAHLAGA